MSALRHACWEWPLGERRHVGLPRRPVVAHPPRDRLRHALRHEELLLPRGGEVAAKVPVHEVELHGGDAPRGEVGRDEGRVGVLAGEVEARPRGPPGGVARLERPAEDGGGARLQRRPARERKEKKDSC